MIRALFAVIVVVAGSGCLRVPTHADNPRFEAPDVDNACVVDDDCVVGGCSSEVCAAVVVETDCMIIEFPPDGDCGCVGGLCQWYVEEPWGEATSTEPQRQPAPAPG